VRLIGEQAVAILEFVVSYLQTLIEGGGRPCSSHPAGLSNWWMCLDGSRVPARKNCDRRHHRLATLFNPVGAIVQLVMAAWNLYTFLRDGCPHYPVVQTVVDAIGNIAAGDRASALKWRGLAGLLPCDRPAGAVLAGALARRCVRLLSGSGRRSTGQSTA